MCILETFTLLVNSKNIILVYLYLKVTLQDSLCLDAHNGVCKKVHGAIIEKVPEWSDFVYFERQENQIFVKIKQVTQKKNRIENLSNNCNLPPKCSRDKSKQISQRTSQQDDSLQLFFMEVILNNQKKKAISSEDYLQTVF